VNKYHDRRGRFTTAAQATPKRPWFVLPDGRKLGGAEQDSGPGAHGRNPPPPGKPATRYANPYGGRAEKTPVPVAPAIRHAVNTARQTARAAIRKALEPLCGPLRRRPPGRP